MTLISNKRRIELTQSLVPIFHEHGRKIEINHIKFANKLNSEELSAVRKILKKFRMGPHDPQSLLAEYHKWEELSRQPAMTRSASYTSRDNSDRSTKGAEGHADHQKRTEKKKKRAAQRRRKNALELALITALRENREFSDYKNVFLAARAKKRRLVAYLGPTNSGKTHAAMEAMASASTGTYLGPLRLMALENYDRLREKGLCAGLLTGEERLGLDKATHICQTIETANFSQNFNVAVIDEIQLLTDKDRGGYWLNAVMGIAADVVYLCGAPIIENILRDLAELTGDELEIIYTERKTPLVIAKQQEDPKSLPDPGAAFIAFSRKNVLLWKDLLENAGAKVSVVYGALSPEVRKEQSRRFREGETDYLVATDAIGMGLNLPIQKVLFTEVEKFDGVSFRGLQSQEIKQIGGRAGRYGLAKEEGVITSYVKKDLKYLRQRYLDTEREMGLSDIHMKPTPAHVRKICESFDNYSLEFALRKFQKIGHDIFSVDISDEQLSIAEKLDRIFGTDPDSLNDRWFFGIAPTDINQDETYDFFLDLAFQYKKYKSQENFSVRLQTFEKQQASLQYAESQRKNLTLYLWFANKKREVFPDHDKAKKSAEFFDNLINKLLARTSRKKMTHSGLALTFCSGCKAMMPPFSRFQVCRDCYQDQKLSWTYR